MLEAALDCRLESLMKRVSSIEEQCQAMLCCMRVVAPDSGIEALAKRVSHIEEQCQVQAEVFLQKTSTSAEQLNAKLHEVGEALGQKADAKALDALNLQICMLRDVITEAVGQVHALNDHIGRRSNLPKGDPWLRWLRRFEAGEQPTPILGSCQPAPGELSPQLLHRVPAWSPVEDRQPEREEEAFASLDTTPIQAAIEPPVEGTASARARRDQLADRTQELPPETILKAILAVERRCNEMQQDAEGSPLGKDSDGLTVECLVDEPLVRYCMCSSLDSPTIISVLSAKYPDILLDDALHALVDKEELDRWNAQGEFKVVEEPLQDDPKHEHIVHYVLRAPWPFWDRDVLQRRWRLPLNDDATDGQGSAVVMRSVSGDGPLPEQPGVVRAFVYGAAFLLRPMHREGCKGTELTYVTQLDIGGLCPAWAQGLLMRIASRGVVEWSIKLSTHCEGMATRRKKP